MSLFDVTKTEPLGAARRTATQIAELAKRVAKLERQPGRIPGELVAYAGASAPVGYLLCDGSAVSRTTYAELFRVIGTTFGAGNGSTTFNLPDLRGRTPYGVGTHADVDTVGKNDGEGVASRSPKHVLTVAEMPSHSHPLGPSNNPQTFTPAGGGNWIAASSGGAGTGVNPGTVAQGGNTAHQHGYLIVGYLIKT